MNLEPIIKAAKSNDKTQWVLADALLKHADEGDTDAVVSGLLEEGYEYSSTHLRRLRQVAENFPPQRRYDGEHNKPVVSLSAHDEAGNPDTLDVIVRVARKEGHPFGKYYIRDVVHRIRAEEREKRKEELEAARKEEDEARAAELLARSREESANDKREKEKHRRERDQAKQKKRKAREKARSIKVIPKRKDLPAPKDGEVGPLAARALFMRNASEAKRLAAQGMKAMKPHLGELSQAAVAGLTDAALTVANTWRDTATKINNQSGHGKGHLSVVNE